MEKNKDVCPYCGGTETAEALQGGYAAIEKTRTIFPKRKDLYHIICLSCGTMIRSYIEYPQDWADYKVN